MSRIDAIKEANARSRLFIGIFIAIDAALIGWIVPQYKAILECVAAQPCTLDGTSVRLVLVALGFVACISSLLVFFDRMLVRRIRELENLE